MNIERRSLTNALGTVEFRADGKTISGLASVYYDGTPETEFALGRGIIERVHPGAFDQVINSGADCFALYHHDDSMMLGRRSAGTLTLTAESRGLTYSVPYDETDPIHQTVGARIRRREVRGSSVSWKIPPSGQRFERRSDGTIIRHINQVTHLYDVGPTHIPSYDGTSAEMRAQLDGDQLDALQQQAQDALIEPPTPVEFYLVVGN